MPLAIYHQQCGLEETNGENTVDFLLIQNDNFHFDLHNSDVHSVKSWIFFFLAGSSVNVV